MFQKVFTNGVAISYGPSLPSTAVADGTIFYKTVSSAGFPAGFYLYGTRPDTNPAKFGPQVGQQWYSADAGDLYLRISGGTLTGPLGLTNYLKIAGSTAQRILFGNTAAVQPIVFDSANKILSIGLGTSFDDRGGVMTTILRADFANLTTGLTWNGQKVWHAGNDGTGSGLDADLLDGFHASVNSTGNSVPVRDGSGDIKARRYYFLADDSAASYGNYPIVDFVTTRGDGLSIRSKLSYVREAIRVNADTDGTTRKLWNVNISGNASTASSVSWTNVANKPAWLNDGTVGWDDVANKPETIYAVNFTQENQARSKSPLEMTSNGTKDVFSGIWVGENVLDMPKNSNCYPDPNGGLAIPNLMNPNFYWAGFQALKAANNACGVQMIANWNSEDFDPNGDGQGLEDKRSVLMYRVNDDNSALNNNTTDLNLFSPWIKVWTNLTLTKVSQLENDAGFTSSTSLGAYLKLSSPTIQTSVGDIAFNGTIFFRTTDNSKGMSFDKSTANITLDGGANFISTTGHFIAPSGNFSTSSGSVHSNSGNIFTGGVNGLGSVFLKPGIANFTGQVLYGTTINGGIWHARSFVDITNKAMCYMINEGGVDLGPTAHHYFNRTIKSTGDVVAYASDGRLKKNIQKIENPVEKVTRLGGYLYDWDLDKCDAAKFAPSNPTEHGLIAQEVLEVVPDAVTESAIGNGFLTVKYERIVPLLTAAISEQAETISNQSTKIDRLEARLAHLEKMIAKLV